MLAKNFDDLRKKMKPERQARALARTKQMLADMPLHELRVARQQTQSQLANVLNVNQAAVSKLERRADMYVSTLRSYIQAMGGDLEITARFPEGAVRLTQFKDE